MQAQRLPYTPSVQHALRALHVNRPICPSCGSDAIREALRCTPHQVGWRECLDCNWVQVHADNCTTCPPEPVRYCHRSSLTVAIASLLAFGALLGLCWLGVKSL